MIQTEEENVANIDWIKKGNDVVRYEVQSNSDLADSNDGWGSKVLCFAFQEEGHTSYACPQWRM